MKQKGFLVWLLLSIVLVGCGDKLDYRHRYTGQFMVVDSFVATLYPSLYPTWVKTIQGEIFIGDDELVLLFEDQYFGQKAMVLNIDREGKLLESVGYPVSGKFQDKDHFEIKEAGEATWYFPSSPFLLYHKGVRIDD